MAQRDNTDRGDLEKLMRQRDLESHNVLTLNLANDTVMTGKTVAAARQQIERHLTEAQQLKAANRGLPAREGNLPYLI